MLSNEIKKSVNEQLISQKESICAQIESGNPFAADRSIDLSKIDNVKGDSECSLEKHIHSVYDLDETNKFLENHLNNAIRQSLKYPKSAKAANDLGQEYLRLNDTENALKYFEKAISIDSSFFPAWANIARCYMLMELYDKAIDVYNRILEERGEDYVSLMNIAQINFIKGKLDTSLNYLNRALKVSPKSSAVWCNIGVVYIGKAQLDKALNALRKALKFSNEKDINVYNNMGVAYLATKSIKKALRYFLIAYNISNYDMNTVSNLSKIYQLLNRHNESINIIERYFNKKQKEVNLLNTLARSYEAVDENENSLHCLEIATDILEKNNDDILAGLHNNIAVVLEKVERFDEALEYYISALKLDEKVGFETHENLIRLKFKKNDLDDCLELIQRAKELYPEKSAVCYALIGDYQFRMLNYKDSEKNFTIAHSLDNELIDPYIGLSMMYIEIHKDIKRTLEILEQGVKYHPDSVPLINNYVYALLADNNVGKANHYAKILATSNDVHCVATQGLLAIKEGNIEKGRILYNKAKKLAKNDKQLEKLVEQKKLLELAKYHIDMGENKKAISYLKKGSLIKTKEKYYEYDIKNLLKDLS